VEVGTREFLLELERDLSVATDIIFALRLATDDDAPVELLNESGELLGRLVAHRSALKQFLVK
jgi:hypothetical protein